MPGAPEKDNGLTRGDLSQEFVQSGSTGVSDLLDRYDDTFGFAGQCHDARAI